MGTEITAGLPASLSAIGLYSGIISVVGMACCSIVSMWERRIRADDLAEAALLPAAPAPDFAPPTPMDAGQLRADFLSRN